jgi:SAM-dependent methyltransferase
MKCFLCGNDDLTYVWSYDEPDKYLRGIEIPGNGRYWGYCNHCDLYINVSDLTSENIKTAYLNYRNTEMRETTIEEEFLKVTLNPNSENKQRCDWLKKNIDLPETMLDIGSGIGVFPFLMKEPPFSVKHISCIEPDPDSANFIGGELHLSCYNYFYEDCPDHIEKSDLATLVHVLEHFEDPLSVLMMIKKHNLKKGGGVFIEVPDSIEFGLLPKEHDEFNSLHLFFFSVSSLDKLLRKAGFNPYLFERVTYKERNLSRIRVLC